MSWLLEKRMGQRVVVNLLDGSALAGRLEYANANAVELVNASLWSEGQSPVDVSGSVIIALDKVSFVNVPPAA